jgi:putative glutamine amidotransferase
VAWAPDGVIEAIEIEGAPHVVSVQWHPEMLVEHAEHLALFEWLTHSATSHVHRPAGIAAG